jgi:hypothetical protein
LPHSPAEVVATATRAQRTFAEIGYRRHLREAAFDGMRTTAPPLT